MSKAGHPTRRTALVTGAGSGIGLAIAEHLIKRHNYFVLLLDVSASRLEEASKQLGESCVPYCADVTQYTELCKAFVMIFEQGGHQLDLFFANAGIGDTDSLYKTTTLDPATGLPLPLNLRTIDVNLNAVLQGIHLARHFISRNTLRPGGRIVLTSSVMGLYAHHCVPIYSATKHALTGLTRSLAPVYAKDHITINSLHPALVDTNLMPSAVRPLWDPDIFTPMSTARAAFDAILADGDDDGDRISGQTIELSKDELVFKQEPLYSTHNIRDMLENHELWEKAAEPIFSRPLLQNASFNHRLSQKDSLDPDAKLHTQPAR